MFRIILLVVSAVFCACGIYLLVTEEQAKKKLDVLMETVAFAAIFFYILQH